MNSDMEKSVACAVCSVNGQLSLNVHQVRSVFCIRIEKANTVCR